MFTRAAARKLFTNIRLKRYFLNKIPVLILYMKYSNPLARHEVDRHGWFFIIIIVVVWIGRWCFDVELVYLCKHLRIPMAEVSVNWTEIPGSKVHITGILHMVFELLLIKVGYGLGIWKIYP